MLLFTACIGKSKINPFSLVFFNQVEYFVRHAHFAPVMPIRGNCTLWCIYEYLADILAKAVPTFFLIYKPLNYKENLTNCFKIICGKLYAVLQKKHQLAPLNYVMRIKIVF